MDRIKVINAAFFLIEFLLAMFLGIVARIFSEEYLPNLSLSYLLIINYSFSAIGILGLGYYYLKYYGDKKVFVGAMFFSLAFTFLSCIFYLFLLMLNFPFIAYEYSGLIIPVIFGVIGFNVLAFRIKPN